MNLSFISIFLLFNVVSYSLAQVPGRFGTSCGYLSQRIYCFGGSASSDVDAISDSNLMYLDIVNGSGMSTAELATKWTPITSITNGINIQSRDNPQSMVLPDGKTLLLSGGWNSADSKLVSQTIAYNADSNSWSGYPSYTEPPFGVRQIYYASSVYVPEYGVGFYGGAETNINPNWTYQGQNMSAYDFSANYSRSIGYTSLTFFDIRKTVDPWYVFPTQNNMPRAFYKSQTSVFDTSSNKIFFFGGGYRNVSSTDFSYYSFKSSVIFDVTTGTWGLQALGGFPPSERTEHTTTLLASTNRDVLLYGGENSFNNDGPSLDYLFTLNLDSYEWKQQNIQNPDASDLTRSRHSAIPVNNNTLFIVFGRSLTGVAVSSMVTLNVTDPSNISYLSTYVDPNGVERPSSSGLSTGVTAGIAVGAIAGGLVIITALFCVWKKKKDEKKKEELEEIKRQNERIEEPVMEVNWEVIDQNYEKFPAGPISNFTYSPRLTDDSTTVADNRSDVYVSPMLIQQGLELQRSNAIEDDVKSSPMKLQKPDGAL